MPSWAISENVFQHGVRLGCSFESLYPVRNIMMHLVVRYLENNNKKKWLILQNYIDMAQTKHLRMKNVFVTKEYMNFLLYWQRSQSLGNKNGY